MSSDKENAMRWVRTGRVLGIVVAASLILAIIAYVIWARGRVSWGQILVVVLPALASLGLVVLTFGILGAEEMIAKATANLAEISGKQHQREIPKFRISEAYMRQTVKLFGPPNNPEPGLAKECEIRFHVDNTGDAAAIGQVHLLKEGDQGRRTLDVTGIETVDDADSPRDFDNLSKSPKQQVPRRDEIDFLGRVTIEDEDYEGWQLLVTPITPAGQGDDTRVEFIDRLGPIEKHMRDMQERRRRGSS